ncbi:LADA_0B08900g1_1 [Lachancea dasiensis]|uniref:LADA_0B08900g1_1 n=1 Tax=Lachancea dasiensis TaxID=1072105 RepID=A0A1G4IUF6_9SACH|nr:LADA_0B08900g1_1 [Lachancea dasiensis]
MVDTDVLLIGAGGVGTMVAFGMDYTKQSKLSIVVRKDFAKVKETGYDIHSVDYGTVKGWKPSHIYPTVEASVATGTVYDFVVITTKNLPDIVKVEELAAPAITPGHTCVVLIQNGFDLAKPFFDKFPNNVVLSGVTLIGSHNTHGTIHHTQTDKSFISYFENPNLPQEVQEASAKRFVSIYSNDKNSCTYASSAKEFRYKKLVYNATLNTVCALTGVDTGRLEQAGGLAALSIPAMREVIAIAQADGVTLPKDVINTTIHGDDGEWFEPSMLVDVKRGNPIELEVILGNLLKTAEKLEVETPILSVLYELLRVVQFRLKEKQGIITVPKERPIYDKVYE